MKEILFYVVLIIAGIFCIPLMLEWLWNITMPDIFQVTEITYWEAFRLILISTLFFYRG